ncbi:MAG: diguanylate cyclase [Pseudomonadota bacterium]
MAIPVMAERAWSLLSERQTEIDSAVAQLKSTAQVVALSQRDTLSSAISITQLLAMQAVDLMAQPERCNALLKEASTHIVGVQGAALLNRAGVVSCASVRVLLGIDLGGRDFLQQALATPGAVISRFLVPRATGRPTLVVAEAQRDVNGDPVAAATVALDLQWVSRVAAEAGAQADSTVVVLDAAGTVIAHHPTRPALVGTPYGDTTKLAKITAQDEGSFEDRADGATWIFAFMRIPGTGMRVVVSRNKEAIAGPIDRRIMATLGGLVAAFALFIALALLAAHRLIVAPINTLAADVESIGRGERVDIREVGIEEFQPVLQAYGEMSDRLQQRARDLRTINGRLAALASLDGLTGLANRRTFDVQFSEDWVRCADAGRPLGLVIADVDNFKLFNDTMGHPAGDVALREVARMLQGALGGEGLAARYGGEEFVVLLPGADIETAVDYAETARRLILALDIAHPKGPMGRLTVSFGVAALVPKTPGSPDALLAAADTALYEAKRLGRNRVLEATAGGGDLA